MPKAQEKSKSDFFVWTDNEVELLLMVTYEYKVAKAMENVDWESCQSKYAEISERLKQQYPAAADENMVRDYPHKMEEITKAIVTCKLKAIRYKYRRAVETGRKAGHGRVILLYFELCEQIWRGSPATATAPARLEPDKIGGTTCEFLSGPESGREVQDEWEVLTDQYSNEPAEIDSRRDRVGSRLLGYKQERRKRKLSTDNQFLAIAHEELKISRRMMEKMVETDNKLLGTMNRLANNLERLTDSIAQGFAMMRQVMLQPPHASPLHLFPHRPATSTATQTEEAAEGLPTVKQEYNQQEVVIQVEVKNEQIE